jgi:hypothetical protein
MHFNELYKTYLDEVIYDANRNNHGYEDRRAVANHHKSGNNLKGYIPVVSNMQKNGNSVTQYRIQVNE